MRYLALILIYFIPWQAKGQLSNLPLNHQRLLLELSSGLYNVATVGQINLDSCLITASSYLKMSRTPVILEGFENEFNKRDILWIDQKNPEIAKKQLRNKSGAEHMKLLLLIGDYYSFQSGKNTGDADSALVYLSKAQGEAVAFHQSFWKSQTDILILKTYLKQNKVAEAEAYFKNILQNTTSESDLPARAKAYYYYATYCPFITDLNPGRIKRLESASAIYQKLNDHTGEIISYTYQSNLNTASGNFPQSRQLSLSALKLEKNIHFQFTQYNEDQVAMIDGFTLNFAEKLNYAQQEVNHSLSNGVNFGMSTFYERLASAYAGNDYSNPETYKWYRKAIDEAIRNLNFYPAYTTLISLTGYMVDKGQAKAALELAKRFLKIHPPQTAADKMRVAGTLGYCYQALKDFPLAEKYFIQGVSLARDPGNASNPMASEAYQNLGFFYVDIKKYEQARPYLSAYLNSPFKVDQMTYYVERYLARIDSAAGNFSSAYLHMLKYSVLQGKTFDKRAISERERIEATYETKEKVQSIKLLESRRKADQAELQKIALQRNLTLGGIFALFLVSVLVYYGYRNKQRSNLILNAQKMEIDEKNSSLEKILTEKDDLLFEKDLLLKEVHHRVKNNLHIVMSLLESQSAYLKDNAALGALLESQNRVQAIALIHQKLYSSDNITQVDMQSYIPELIDYLNESLNTSSQHITISQQIEPIFMDVSQAIPVGIILNEAVTNAMKYAFPSNAVGEINISMQYINGLVCLEISDNGVGFPNGFDFQKANSLGMNLMKGLINQLKGTFKFNVNNGVNIRIKFSLDHISALN